MTNIRICGENACLAPFKECRHLEQALCFDFSRDLLNGTIQIHSKTIGRSQAINVWNNLQSLLYSTGVDKPGFFKQCHEKIER